MLPSLLWVSLDWPPFQLLNVRDKSKGWRTAPFTFLWIGIPLLDSLLVDAQRSLVHARTLWLVKALIVFPLFAQIIFMKTSYCQDCRSSARLGWIQPRSLKLMRRKIKHAHSSQTRNWNLLSLAGVLHLQAAHNPNSFFLQPSILLSTSKQKKTLKAVCDWGMIPTDSGQQWDCASDCSSLHNASLHCFILFVGNNALSAPWKTKACGRSPRASRLFCFDNLIGESLWLLA